ncbi:LOW QUALITY PROTEIN: Gag protein [Phytophthora palmivora]|uniref:Gag protein n=1 Tax=Phytophthora palmivora TaxID=4796 RepID=A0A2P4WY68_9STRA|nr:LOW QUALITY PROTEIN: Gag protein [Phytophthora palmivora]
MCFLASSLVVITLPEHIKVAVFLDGIKVGPSRPQSFSKQANTMEKEIQITLQEERRHRQARAPTVVTLRRVIERSAGTLGNGIISEPMPLELDTAQQNSIHCYGCGSLGNMRRAFPVGGQNEVLSQTQGVEGPMAKAMT